MELPKRVLRDEEVWGFQPSYDDAALLVRLDSPRRKEYFGDAAGPIDDGDPLATIVRDLCEQYDVAQPFIWAKLIGETSFLTAPRPAGKGYKAPIGFDCPDNGRDPRPEFYGVRPNLRGCIAWFGTFREVWDVARRRQ